MSRLEDTRRVDRDPNSRARAWRYFLRSGRMDILWLSPVSAVPLPSAILMAPGKTGQQRRGGDRSSQPTPPNDYPSGRGTRT